MGMGGREVEVQEIVVKRLNVDAGDELGVGRVEFVVPVKASFYCLAYLAKCCKLYHTSLS